jgi:hypothetical protein
MKVHKHPLIICGVVAALFLAVGPGVMYAQERAADLQKLRVLLVIDSNSNLKKSVLIDQGSMTEVLKVGVPPSRYDLKVLSGDNATPDRIIEYYRNLKTGPDEGLLFFYAGHGGTKKDHTLTMQGGHLSRQTLINAMRQKRARLIVVLTDCCSTPIRVKPDFTVGALPPPPEPTEIAPLHRCLFFQHRGIVDITAATLDASLGDEEIGGFFTHTFNQLMLRRQLKDFKTSDGFLTWRVFYDVLKQDTNALCQGRIKKAIAAGQKPGIDKQIPKAFQLADGGEAPRPKWRFGVQVFNHGGTGVRVNKVFPDTPAHQAGLEAGDVIVAIDSQPVRNEDDFAQAIDGSEGQINVQLRSAQTQQMVTKAIKLERIP